MSDADVKAGKIWKYIHSAVSDKPGMTRFTKQSREKETAHGPGFEGGKLQPDTATGPDTEEVPLITIDGFLEDEATKKNLRYPAYTDIGGTGGDDIKYHVDLLKIDAEGNDNKVIAGARKAIENTVSLFAFEGGKGITFDKDFIDELDTKHGYNCYSTSRAGLFKWNGGCMHDKYMGGYNAKDKGNIFCANRKRSPFIALLFDALTFPSMLEALERQTRLTGSTDKEFDLDTLDRSELARSYINIKPFCDPYPACLLPK